MGAYKVLITFSLVEEIEINTKNDGSLLSKYFEEVREWTEEEVCQTRQVSVECMGVLLYAWYSDNQKKNRGVWEQ